MNTLLTLLEQQIVDLEDTMALNVEVLAESDPSEIDALLNKLQCVKNILNDIQLDNQDD